MPNHTFFTDLANKIISLKKNLIFKIAIDGVDGSGKTVFTRRLYDALTDFKCKVCVVSIDGFHHPKEIRYQRGELSPEGYYYDSFDNDFIVSKVFEPLMQGGDRKIIPRKFDYKTNGSVMPNEMALTDEYYFIFEGVFLHRPELLPYWDFTIFLDCSFSTILERVKKRDLPFLKSEQVILQKYEQRYIPGQRLYLSECDPKSKAHLVIDNNNFDHPMITIDRMINLFNS